MTILRGPANPEAFRIQHGRYGDRWYMDNLPSCDIAEATTDDWPAMSLVKNAWPKFLNKWIADSVAQRAVDDWDDLARLNAQARFAVLASAATAKRDDAASRGTRIHSLLERLALGLPVDEVWDADVEPFVPVARKLIDDLQPEWLFSEAVVISRTHRVGGTADAGWLLGDGRRYLVDFKTRLKHSCYDDEGVQVAGYATADYMIVDDNGTPKRQLLPTFDAGLIVTITPDSYELHPVDLDKAAHAFQVLRAFWDVQQGRNLIGKPIFIAPKIASGSATPNLAGAAPAGVPVANGAVAPVRDGTAPVGDGGLRAEHAYQRLKVLAEADIAVRWPVGVPTFAQARADGKEVFSHDELTLIEAALSDAEAEHQVPFPPAEPKPSPEALTLMIERLKALPSDLLAVVESAAAEGRIPNLRTSMVNIRHLDSLEQILSPLEAEALSRAWGAAGPLAELADDTLADALVELTGAADLPHATEAHLQRLDALLLAIDDGVIVTTFTEDGWTIEAGPNAEDAIVAAGDGARARAMRIAKDIAKANDLPNPRTVAIAAANPLLAALIAASVRVAA